jgi:hypothetical protein
MQSPCDMVSSALSSSIFCCRNFIFDRRPINASTKTALANKQTTPANATSRQS